MSTDYWAITHLKRIDKYFVFCNCMVRNNITDDKEFVCTANALKSRNNVTRCIQYMAVTDLP